VTNFSARACEERAKALADGTAKPTLESIPDPDDTIIARIQKRRDGEAQLAQDAQVAPTNKAAAESSSAPGLSQSTPSIVAQQLQAPQENLTVAIETGNVEKSLAFGNGDVEMAVDNVEIS
jgi:DNA replication initiation complex subunit (GINS family)